MKDSRHGPRGVTKSPPRQRTQFSNKPSIPDNRQVQTQMTMSLKFNLQLPVLTRSYISKLQNESFQRIKNGFVCLRKQMGLYPSKFWQASTTQPDKAVAVSDIVTSLSQDLLEEFITRVCGEITVSMDSLLTEMNIQKTPRQQAGPAPLSETLTTSMLNNTAGMSGPGLSLHRSPKPRKPMQRAFSYHKIPARSK